MPIWITLTPADIKEGDAEGNLRQDNRERSRSVHRNNRPRDNVKDRINHIKAAKSELAAYLALGTKYWNKGGDIVGQKKRPDLDHFVDVKFREIDRHSLIVQLDDDPSWVYLSVCIERYPTYCIDFWAWGRDIMLERYKETWVEGRKAYFVRKDSPFVRDAPTLIPIIQERWKTWLPAENLEDA